MHLSCSKSFLTGAICSYYLQNGSLVQSREISFLSCATNTCCSLLCLAPKLYKTRLHSEMLHPGQWSTKRLGHKFHFSVDETHPASGTQMQWYWKFVSRIRVYWVLCLVCLKPMGEMCAVGVIVSLQFIFQFCQTSISHMTSLTWWIYANNSFQIQEWLDGGNLNQTSACLPVHESHLIVCPSAMLYLPVCT